MAAVITRTDLVVDQGATFLHRFIVDGTPDLTSPAATATLQVREAIGGTIVVESTEGSGLTLGTAGEVDWRVEASEPWTSDGSTLTFERRYVYDLAVTLGGGGNTIRVAEGHLSARPAVTQPPP